MMADARVICCTMAFLVSVAFASASSASSDMAVFARLGAEFDCNTTDFTVMMNGMLAKVDDKAEVGMPRSRVTVEFELNINVEETGMSMPGSNELDDGVQASLEKLAARWGVPPSVASVDAIKPVFEDMSSVHSDSAGGSTARFKSLRFKAVAPASKKVKYEVKWVVSTAVADVFVADHSKGIMCGALTDDLATSMGVKASSDCPTVPPATREKQCSASGVTSIEEAVAFAKETGGCSTKREDQTNQTVAGVSFACEQKAADDRAAEERKYKRAREGILQEAIQNATKRLQDHNHNASLTYNVSIAGEKQKLADDTAESASKAAGVIKAKSELADASAKLLRAMEQLAVIKGHRDAELKTADEVRVQSKATIQADLNEEIRNINNDHDEEVATAQGAFDATTKICEQEHAESMDEVGKVNSALTALQGALQDLRLCEKTVSGATGATGATGPEGPNAEVTSSALIELQVIDRRPTEHCEYQRQEVNKLMDAVGLSGGSDDGPSAFLEIGDPATAGGAVPLPTGPSEPSEADIVGELKAEIVGAGKGVDLKDQPIRERITARQDAITKKHVQCALKAHDELMKAKSESAKSKQNRIDRSTKNANVRRSSVDEVYQEVADRMQKHVADGMKLKAAAQDAVQQKDEAKDAAVDAATQAEEAKQASVDALRAAELDARAILVGSKKRGEDAKNDSINKAIADNQRLAEEEGAKAAQNEKDRRASCAAERAAVAKLELEMIAVGRRMGSMSARLRSAKVQDITTTPTPRMDDTTAADNAAAQSAAAGEFL